MAIELEGLKLYDVEELAQLLKVQEKTIRAYLRSGRLQGRKLARKWYVTSDSIKDYFSPEAISEARPPERIKQGA